MRVVLDTNIYVSFLISSPRGSIMKLLQFWEQDKFVVLTSKAILEELAKVLLDKRLKRYICLSKIEVRQYLRFIGQNSLVLRVKNQVKIIEEDPSDNKFLSLAELGRVEFIISGDKHLLKLKQFKKTKIVSPREFVRLISKKSAI